MAKTEGIRRIIVAGRQIILIGITIGVLGSWGLGLPGFLLGIGVVVFGAVVWTAGWIVAGFTNPDP